MKSQIKKKIEIANKNKIIFTAGPASLAAENLNSLKPCFGRGDKEYTSVENFVLSKILKMSGQKKIARLQGSGSLAIEIMCLNLLNGKILIIDTGYYSDRIKTITKQSKKINKEIKIVKSIDWKDMDKLNEKFDWIFACPTETSCGLKIPIKDLYNLKKRLKAKLILDATGSFGLEENHNLADALSFSSCKGLFGLTGACFICFSTNIVNEIKSFYLNLNNHLDKKMTGPYHTIYSLFEILKDYESFKYSVKQNKKIFLKKMKNYLTLPNKNQPLLCTHINKIVYSNKKNVILYQPRNNLYGSIVCHLGEVHLKRFSKGEILDNLLVK